jgi:FAD synthetase
MDDGKDSLSPYMKSKKILIFGVFDGIHEGHLSFVSAAKKEGDQLIAVVARDTSVEEFKGRLPKYNEVDRIKTLLLVPEIDLVLLGDLEQGTYNVLKEVNPDVVFLGYDQHLLCDDLKNKIKSGYLNEMEIITAMPHKPEEFHSSIINSKSK